MKDLLYKEFRLARHETMFFFPLFAFMLLIPSYPYYVAFIYTGLEVFFIFQNGLVNKDTLFTVMLPVRKRDVVKARCMMIVLIQLFQIAFAVPFAILRAGMTASVGLNGAGLEANVALFGCAFLMYALFNALLLPIFYQDAHSAGKGLLIGGSAVMLFIAAVEATSFLMPGIDTIESAVQLRQIPFLALSMAVYAVGMVLTYKRSAKLFEKVDL